MKWSIIITTVFLPKILEAFARNFEVYARKDEVEIVVIGDLKSPAETHEYVARFAKQGFHFEYWDVGAQKHWLQRFPELAREIPHNSDNRRNVGYLIAYERGRDCLIALDDDNYPTDADYIGGYEKVGTTGVWKTVSSTSGWYNNCQLLETEERITIYPRGYPYAYRWLTDEQYTFFESEGRLVVKAGLWLGDPDVDAVTRLSHPVNSIALKESELILDYSTNCPFNTQNTAFHRDLVPSYYYVLMGQMVDGLRIDRYGDIWSSYFARKVIDQMGDRVGFGSPVTRHDRHAHDLLKDLGQEYPGMVLTNRLVELLSDIELTATDYGDGTVELSHKLEAKVAKAPGFSEEAKVYIRKICRNMRLWVDVCRELG